MLPNWLHGGAAKCASTWLWRVCKGHPEICVPETPDNVNFFTVHYQRGLDWYQRQYFSNYAGEPVVGEFSNSYLWHVPAIERIARDLPGVRMTFLLRNPIDRAYLAWAHLHLKNKPSGLDMRKGIGIPFEKVLDHHGHSWFGMWIDPGYYARHLKNLFRFIPRERVRVMIYDDLKADNASVLRGLWEWLGVDPDYTSPLVGKDVNPDPADLWDYLKPEVRAELVEVYREDNAKLCEMLGRDLTGWLT